MVDGLPGALQPVEMNECAERGCQLPGGHPGPHEDASGEKFLLEENEVMDDEAMSSSSEELATTPRGRKREPDAEDKEVMYAMEIEVTLPESKLQQHLRKAAIWLSKKMKVKGQEARWQTLPEPPAEAAVVRHGASQRVEQRLAVEGAAESLSTRVAGP